MTASVLFIAELPKVRWLGTVSASVIKAVRVVLQETPSHYVWMVPLELCNEALPATQWVKVWDLFNYQLRNL